MGLPPDHTIVEPEISCDREEMGEVTMNFFPLSAKPFAWPSAPFAILLLATIVLPAVVGCKGCTATTLPPLTSTGSSHFVQWSTGDAGSVTTSRTYEGQAAIPGDVIVVFCHWNGAQISATIHDQAGNRYVAAFPAVTVSPNHWFGVWYTVNASYRKPLAVMAAFSRKTTSYAVIDVAEYSGFTTISPLDAKSLSMGSGMTQDSRALTTSNANDTIIVWFGYTDHNLPYSAGADFAKRKYEATTMLEDRDVTSVGSYSATATSYHRGNWIAFALAFKDTGP